MATDKRIDGIRNYMFDVLGYYTVDHATSRRVIKDILDSNKEIIQREKRAKERRKTKTNP
jgi:hypothetical protein